MTTASTSRIGFNFNKSNGTIVGDGIRRQGCRYPEGRSHRSTSAGRGRTHKRNPPKADLQQSGIKLHTYTGEQVVVVGSITVTVCYNTQVIELPLLIVKGEGPSLFGRNWLSQIKLDWGAINQVTPHICNKVLDKYPDVFKDELGTLQGTRAKIHVDPQATPKFFKPRSVPYILRERVEKELDRLLSEGIIEPVLGCAHSTHSQRRWEN